MDDTTNRDSPRRSHISPFERIRQAEDEHEFWSARDLAEVLSYTQWRTSIKRLGVPSAPAGIVVRIPPIIFLRSPK